MAKRSFRRIIAKRLVNVVLTCIGIMILNFMLIHFMPGDPINNVIPHTSKFDPSLKWELREKFHLNDTLEKQLGWYLWNTFTGDWGTSYMQNQRKVIDIISQDLQWTFLLVGISTVFTVVIGMGVGAYSAYRRGGAFDVAATSTSLFFYGMPTFWFALVLQTLFTHPFLGMEWWPQFPPGGYYNTVRYGATLHWSWPVFVSIAQHLVLPSLTLSIGYLAGVSIIMKSALVDTMTDDYILTARAKGLTDFQVLRRHALPNGMPPMVALIAMDMAFVLGGAYQVEYVFNYQGIGYRTIQAIGNLDFPILQFIVVVGGVAVVIANFAADMILLYIDPRIKIA